MPRTIIVPLDGSEFAERALTPAHVLARQSGASLVLAMSRLGGVEDPERYLQSAAEGAGISSARSVVSADVLAATAIPMLATTEPDPVVCMATHARRGAGVALFGSIAEEVLRGTDVPLVLVGPSVEKTHDRFGELIVCLDGLQAAAAILPAATTAACDLELELWLVEVVHPNRRYDAGPIDTDTLESTTLQRVARGIEGRHVKVSWETLHGDDPAAAIVDFAKTSPSPLIAMTTHGRTGLARVVAGSVTISVVHHAPCPVLITRTHELGA